MALTKTFNITDGLQISNIVYDTKEDNYRHIDYVDMNCIINFFGGDYLKSVSKAEVMNNIGQGFNIELIYYKEPFAVPNHIVCDPDMINDSTTFASFESMLGQRKFKRIGDVAVPLKENVLLSDFEKTILRGGKRAKDNFYNYALSNNWEYFCTYTFAERNLRVSLELLSYYWKIFVQSVKYKFPGVKVLAVPELFENEENGFHLHALMANCDLTLVPKRYNPNDKQDRYRSALDDLPMDVVADNSDKDALIKLAAQRKTNPSKYTIGQFLYTPYGAPRMQCLNWKKGFNEVVMINPASAQLQIVNYLSKYMTKGFNLPYGQRRFYKTSNLDCKFKYIENYEKEKIDELVSTLNLRPYLKSNSSKSGENKVQVYRNF